MPLKPDAHRPDAHRESVEQWRQTWRLRKLVESSPPGTFHVDWDKRTATYVGPGCKAEVTPEKIVPE
jgi:hypothetical protein